MSRHSSKEESSGIPVWWIAGGGALFGLVTVVLLSTYTVLPPLLGNLFEKGIKDEMGLRKMPEVSLTSEPPPKMLAGVFTSGRISIEAADFGVVRPREVVIELDPFELAVLKSLRRGGLASRQPLSGDVRMEVSEKEASRIADTAIEDVPIKKLELEKGRATVESGTELFGVDVPVSVQGELEVRGKNLLFEPRRVSAFGVRVPDRLSEELLAQADFSYPLEGLPYEAEITGVEVRKDYLVLSGRLRRITLGGDGA